MRLLLLHGPAIKVSREKLLQIKRGFNPDNILVFEKGSNVSDILANLRSESLFGGERLVILENPPEDFAVQLPTTNYQLPTTLVFWFDHEIDSKKYPSAQVFFFPEQKEVSVFPFLDFLGQKDKKVFYELDKLKKAEFESQYFITMILYLLRNLVVTPKKAADFVKKKNARLRENFSREELMGLYRNILEIDFKIKSGLMETPQADFSMVNGFLR